MNENGIGRGGHGGGGHGPGGAHWGGHPGGGHWEGTPSRPGGAHWDRRPGVPLGATAWGPTDPYFVEPPPAFAPMTPDLAAAGQLAFEQSGTYPAIGYANDGALYQFSFQGGALVAQRLPDDAGLGNPPPPPTGIPLFEVGAQVAAEMLHAAEKEIDREIESVKGSVGDPPPLPTKFGPDPIGQSIKSIETPGYLQDPPVGSHHAPSAPAVSHPAPVVPAASSHERLSTARAAHVARSHELSAAVAAAIAAGDHERWRREYERFEAERLEFERFEREMMAIYEQPVVLYEQPAIVRHYYLYRHIPGRGWTPVAPSWLSFADAQKWMVETDPDARYGAYDQTMNWQPMSIS